MIIFSLILFVMVPSKVHGQTSGLITLLPDDNSISLSAEEQQALAELQANPSNANIRFVAINITALEESSTTIQLSGGESVGFSKTELENTSYGTTEWIGVSAENFGMAVITISGKNFFGMIDIGGRSYQVMDLGIGSNHVLMERLMRTPEFDLQDDDVPPDTTYASFGNSTTPAPASIEKRNIIGNNLRVLIVYTPKAELIAYKNGTTIKDLSTEAVKYTNQSYRYSKIDNKMEIARLIKVDYQESDDAGVSGLLEDSKWFNANPYIASLRKMYSADIAVLITGTEQDNAVMPGISVGADEGPKPELGFSQVRIIKDAPPKNFWETFAHETGHLQGADHDLAHTTWPIKWSCEPYAHGYNNAAEGWHTIMSYSNLGNTSVIPYFSNPYVKHPQTGSPLGDPNCCNNARALNENKDLVKDYRVPKNDLTVSDFSLPASEIADFIAINSIHVSHLITTSDSHTGFKAGSEIVFEKNIIINGKLKTSLATVSGCASGKIYSMTPQLSELPACPGTPMCFELNCVDSYTVTVFDITRGSNNPTTWIRLLDRSGTVTDGKVCVPMDRDAAPGKIYGVWFQAKDQELLFSVRLVQGNCSSGNTELVSGCVSGEISSFTPEQRYMPACPGTPMCFELSCADTYTIKITDVTNLVDPSTWFEVFNGSGTITNGKICVPMDQNVRPGNKYTIDIKAKNSVLEKNFRYGIVIDQSGTCPIPTCPTGDCPLGDGTARIASEVKPEDQQVTISDEPFHSTIHPNPVSNSAVIEYYLPDDAVVSITVFNGMGKQVLKLQDDQLLSEGRHSANFDTSHLKSGLYTYNIQAGEKYLTGRFVIVR